MIDALCALQPRVRDNNSLTVTIKCFSRETEAGAV